MKSPRSKPTPNWKQLVLASPDWPDNLAVPQNDPLPKDSEAIQDSMSTKENWEWELWRHPALRHSASPPRPPRPLLATFLLHP